MKATIEIPSDTQVMAGGFPLSLSGRVEVEFGWVDHGIGSYEYWGSVGYDSRMGPEDAVIVGLDLEDKLPEAVTADAVVAALNEKMDKDEKFEDAIYLACSEVAEEGPDDY